MVYKIDEANCSNSFILTEDGLNCLVFDPADPRAFEECALRGLSPKAVFLTHGHFDHVGGCYKFSGVPIFCGERESKLIFSREYLGIFGGVQVPKFEIERGLKDGEEIEIASINLKVLSTPGHTAGSVCYLVGDKIFTGDTLFRGSVGRTDLPTGDYKELFESLKKLKALDRDYKLYCGHGADSDLDFEKKYNPYLSRC